MSELYKLNKEEMCKIWDDAKFSVYPDKIEYEVGNDITVIGISEHCHISYNKNGAFMFSEGASEIEIRSLIDVSRVVSPVICDLAGINKVQWAITGEALRYMLDKKLCKIVGTSAYYDYKGKVGSVASLCKPIISNYADLMNNLRSTLQRERCYNPDREEAMSKSVYNDVTQGILFGLSTGYTVPITCKLYKYLNKYYEIHNIIACNRFNNMKTYEKLIQSIAAFVDGKGLPLRIIDKNISGLQPMGYKDIQCILTGRWWYILQNL